MRAKGFVRTPGKLPLYDRIASPPVGTSSPRNGYDTPDSEGPNYCSLILLMWMRFGLFTATKLFPTSTQRACHGA